MFFRFGSAVVLMVLVALVGTALEKHSLELRRRLIRQHYHRDALMEQHARLRLQAQQLGAPVRMLDTLSSGRGDLSRSQQPCDTTSNQPLSLPWRTDPSSTRP